MIEHYSAYIYIQHLRNVGFHYANRFSDKFHAYNGRCEPYWRINMDNKKYIGVV